MLHLYRQGPAQDEQVVLDNSDAYDTVLVIDAIKNLQSSELTNLLQLSGPDIKHNRLARLAKECNVDFETIVNNLEGSTMRNEEMWTPEQLRENMHGIFKVFETTVNMLKWRTRLSTFQEIKRAFESTTGK